MSRPKPPDVLSRIEEILLLAVWELGEEAYGVPIRRRVEELLNRRLSVGSVYVPLDRMALAGLLSAEFGPPTAVRGGRRKRYYRLTAKGIAALRQTRRLSRRIWAGKPALLQGIHSPRK
ncbi:MAG TPA: helix-turn-helix transcriptional regulator [Anaerolineales bacterium]